VLKIKKDGICCQQHETNVWTLTPSSVPQWAEAKFGMNHFLNEGRRIFGGGTGD
jgi:hypothetical protein